MAARSPVRLLREILFEVRENKITFMAGSLAYSAFVSLIPLLLLVLVAASVVGGATLRQHVLGLTGSFLTQNGQELIVGAIVGSGARAGISVLGLITLVWGMLKIFRGIDIAFSELYGSRDRNRLVDQLRDGIIVFGSLLLALVAAGLAASVYALFPDAAGIGIGNTLLLILGLAVAFFPMYYVFPDADVSVREVLPGVFVAAVGWTVLKGLFRAYVAYAGSYEVYGVIGGVLLLLSWLYFSSLVLLLGAVVNLVLAGRGGRSAAGLGDPDRVSG